MLVKRGRPKKKTVAGVKVETKEPIITPQTMLPTMVDIVDTKDTLMYTEDLISMVNAYNESLVPGGKLIMDVPIFPNPACFNSPNVKQIFNQHTMLCFAKISGAYNDIGKDFGCLPFSRIIVNVLNGFIHVELTK